MEWNQMLIDQDLEEKKLSEDCNKKYINGGKNETRANKKIQ